MEENSLSNEVVLFSDNELAKLAGESGNSNSYEYSLTNFSNETLGYLSNHQSLEVKVINEEKVTVKALTFFVKSQKKETNDFERAVFKRESTFFSDVVPLMNQNFKSEPWIPQCFLVKNGILVMEDLKVQGFESIKGSNFGIDYWKSAMEALARFHVSSILLEERIQKPLSDLHPGLFEEIVFVDDNGLSWRWLLAGIEIAEIIAQNLNLDPTFIAKAYNLTLERIRPSKKDLNVFCHSDLWYNNMMFKKNNEQVECRLVDFQMTAYTSYAIDLLQFMYMNIDGDLKNKYEKELMKVYHSKLVQELEKHEYQGQIVSFEKILKDADEKRICGLVAAVQLFPIALLSKEFSRQYMADSEKFEYYSFTTRAEFIKTVMEADDGYRKKLEDAVSDLVEYMKTIVN
ncbi:hypothetical protein QAD02_009316 [Eretmocerus hayati]|uniref:Uncharacterized protein n=1 Tax=Eretmocerus hayati TaxID=131215 RepID=A0ACC2NA84_9HYME|nr:hypothetical protein QAD02_009316 [Eretmocerus hayati]